MKLPLFTILLFTSIPALASEASLLELDSEHPYRKCVVTANSVRVEKQAGTIRYSKNTDFVISDKISSLIALAYNQKHSSDETTLYSATYFSPTGQSKKFPLELGRSAETDNLIRFLNQICND